MASSTGIRPGARCWSRIARRAPARRRSSASRAPGASPSSSPISPSRCGRRATSRASGDYIVFERSTGGNEAVAALPPRPRDPAGDGLLRAGHAARHGRLAEPSCRLLYSSVPLDRTASGGRRAEIAADADPGRPGKPRGAAQARRAAGQRLVCSAACRGTTVAAAQPLLLRQRFRGLAARPRRAASARRVLPAPGSTDKAVHLASEWKRDDSGFFFVSDRGGEFRELMFHSLADGRHHARHPPHQGRHRGLEPQPRRPAARGARQRRGPHRACASSTPPPSTSCLRRRCPKAASPRRGSIRAAGPRLHAEQQQGAEPDRHADAGDGGSQALDPALRPARASTPSRFGEQQIVRWKSFDGREITGIAAFPPARFPGRRPVLINIHGGPEAEASSASSAAPTTTSRSSASP